MRRRSSGNAIGTEYLLLARLRQENSHAPPVLTEHGVTLEKTRGAVESIVGRGQGSVTDERQVTPRARFVLDLALVEARWLRQESISAGLQTIGTIAGPWEFTIVLPGTGGT